MTGTGQDWETYWEGRKSDQTGALTGIEHDRELKAFWSRVLDPLPRTLVCADLACGAGTVLQTAHQLGFTLLTGIDVSESALQTLKQSLPEVQTCVSSISDLPYQAAHFDLMTSQFGLEYAGAKAACEESARVLRPGGRFIAVMHMTEGAIHEEVSQHAQKCAQIRESDFINLSLEFFAAAYAGDQTQATATLDRLIPARDQVTALVKPSQASFAAHLLQGAAQLWERRAHYALSDISGWFEGMQAELTAYEGRMTSMLKASQTAAEMATLVTAFRQQGVQAEAPNTLDLGGKPAAWVLQAERPG